MRLIRLNLALHAACLGVLLVPAPVCGSAFGQAPTAANESPSAVYEMLLPGGVGAAVAVLKDPVPADRSQFLVEVIRRTYAIPIATRIDPRDVALRALLAHLDRARRTASPAQPTETVPLPLNPALWIEAVFGGRATPDTLAASILESRNASLFYYGLLSLDGPTRSWLGGQRNLVAELSSRYAPEFAVAAPGFRVAGGRVRVPGGPPVESAWESLVGKRLTEPADFLRAVLTQDDAQVGYLLTAMGELPSPHIELATGTDPASRATALRRLRGILDRVAPGWKVAERTLWRPRRDPALLLSDLALDERGRPLLPGSRAFWEAVFSSDPGKPPPQRTGEPADAMLDVSWLCEQVFTGTAAEQKRKSDGVLFASRVVRHVTPANATDALAAVRSAIRYPALVAVLERAGVSELSTYAVAARRAAGLSAISGGERRARAHAQFQGTLGLLARMESRRSLTPEAFRAAVDGLSRVQLNDQGEYAGALVQWFATWLDSPDAMGRILQLLAGPAPAPARSVDWEGTRYKLDLAAAESARLARLLGDHPPPYLSAAQTLASIASSLGTPAYPKAQFRNDVQRLEALMAEIDTQAADWQRTLAAAAAHNDTRDTQRLAPRLSTAADDLWARGVIALVYAVALGQPESVSVSVAEIAARHDFGWGRESAAHGRNAWVIPTAEVSARGYRISGSLLGLEVALAEFSLTRVSIRQPPRKPTISSEERSLFIASVPLVAPARLSDDDRDRIVSAIRSGRARVDAIRDDADAHALAAELPLGPIRRTLLPWVAAHDRRRLAPFLSPLELLWAGHRGRAMDESVHEWGVSAQARIGCLCLQVLDRRPEETLTGRVNAGILASGFPDLGLRLAELLSELNMPAALFGGVLASATFDFVNGAASRDEDDRRGLVEFVLALRVDRVEEYLALLTTGGPLVPPRDDSDRLERAGPAGRRP